MLRRKSFIFNAQIGLYALFVDEMQSLGTCKIANTLSFEQHRIKRDFLVVYCMSL
jgi:hypothetical protein